MIHKEGYRPLILTLIAIVILNIVVRFTLPSILPYFSLLSAGFYLFLISFFRNPNRSITEKNEDVLYAPADGKVVVIEEIVEPSVLKEKCRQISIFMSPLNVHVNRNPMSGEVLHSEYHPGKFLPAWDPKSSTENERTTILYHTRHGKILMRQIAGALAKRIVNYLKTGDKVIQGEDMGFIKLGSRVDLYIPLDAKVEVNLNDVVKGNRTIIARW
jgi:phosphatidylserine decarboxylase